MDELPLPEVLLASLPLVLVDELLSPLLELLLPAPLVLVGSPLLFVAVLVLVPVFVPVALPLPLVFMFEGSWLPFVLV